MCEGESVYESRDTASENIRNAIRALVDEGQLTDDEIIGVDRAGFGGQVLLVPKATGFDALVWALPVAALVCAVAGLAVTFRRWRREAADRPRPDGRGPRAGRRGAGREDDGPPDP